MRTTTAVNRNDFHSFRQEGFTGTIQRHSRRLSTSLYRKRNVENAAFRCHPQNRVDDSEVNVPVGANLDFRFFSPVSPSIHHNPAESLQVHNLCADKKRTLARNGYCQSFRLLFLRKEARLRHWQIDCYRLILLKHIAGNNKKDDEQKHYVDHRREIQPSTLGFQMFRRFHCYTGMPADYRRPTLNPYFREQNSRTIPEGERLF